MARLAVDVITNVGRDWNIRRRVQDRTIGQDNVVIYPFIRSDGWVRVVKHVDARSVEVELPDKTPEILVKLGEQMERIHRA